MTASSTPPAVRASSIVREGTAWRLAAIIALALCTGHATAQVYKVTDPEQGVIFTDRPDSKPGSTVEEIEVPTTNSAAPPPALPQTGSQAREREEEQPAEPTVTITSPADETTIAMGPGNFSVSAQVDPPLSRGETLVLTIDGQAYGAAQTGRSWFVEGALRGPHDLVVQRVGRGGSALAVSDPVRVYVLRPSIIRR